MARLNRAQKKSALSCIRLVVELQQKSTFWVYYDSAFRNTFGSDLSTQSSSMVYGSAGWKADNRDI
jgi:hypothetical protein